MKTASRQIKEYIKRRETLRLEAYLDRKDRGVWTIGYGTTKNVRKGMKITKEEAEAFFDRDLQESVNAVNRYVLVELSQNQFDALVSFIYNVGSSAFKKSTLLRVLNQGQYNLVPIEMRRWVYDDGVKLAGLVARRAEEVAFWNLLDPEQGKE